MSNKSAACRGPLEFQTYGAAESSHAAPCGRKRALIGGESVHGSSGHMRPQEKT
jgi:hypothetical protein